MVSVRVGEAQQHTMTETNSSKQSSAYGKDSYRKYSK